MPNMPELKCLRCGHEWIARKADARPVCCPRCKQTKWDEVPRAYVRKEPAEVKP